MAHVDPETNAPPAWPARDHDAGQVDPPPPGVADAGTSDAGTDAAASLTALAGSQTLIDIFPFEGGAFIVHSEGVLRVDHAGATTKTWSAPRAVTSAAFDGARLAIADKAILTALDVELAVISSAPLIESCQASVVLSGGRFVCGPANDWDRVFYVYDLATGKLLGSSPKYTYNGIPMRRVPGTNDFVSVSVTTSPSDFHLYRVSDANAVEYIGESPYHGDFPVTGTYAFSGSPATHVVTQSGLLLAIYDSMCVLGTGGLNGSCFFKDGDLGTLADSETFVGLDESPDAVFGLASASDGIDGVCKNGCTLEKIDVPGRSVVSRRKYMIPTSRILVFRHDPFGGRAWVGFTPPATTAGDPAPGYRVMILDY